MFLGIDFGLKHIGLALSQGELAEPLGEIKNGDLVKVVKQINQLCQDHGVDQIILGLPSGPLEAQVKAFGRQLESGLGLPVIFSDETLSSQEALAKSLHMGQQKRRQLQHAVAASLILQDYLDRINKGGNV